MFAPLLKWRALLALRPYIIPKLLVRPLLLLTLVGPLVLRLAVLTPFAASVEVHAEAEGAESKNPIALTWADASTLFRQRYGQRSSNRYAKEIAELKAATAGGWQVDPVLTTNLSRDVETHAAQISSKLTQGTPFGTELSASHQRSDLRTDSAAAATSLRPNKTTTAVELSQQLLKGGPLFGLALEQAISHEKNRDELQAAIEFDQALYDAMAALTTAEEAQQRLAATQSALQGAEAQHQAVMSLVNSGFKPKADLLVSEASMLRSHLANEEAKQNLAAALRALATAMLQRSGDPLLAVSDNLYNETDLKRLDRINWPAMTPQERLSMLTAEAAKARADLAWRDDLPQLAAGVGMERAVGYNGNSVHKRTISISLSMPLVGAIKREAASLAALQAQSAAEAFIQTQRAMMAKRLDLETRVKVAGEALEVARRLRSMGEKTLEIEQQKYADGNSTANDLRQAQEDLNQANLSVIAAHKELVLSRLALAQAAGALQEALP